MSWLCKVLLISCLLTITADDIGAEDPAPAREEELQEDKLLDILPPEAAEAPIDSKVLEKAFRELMARFVEDNAKDIGPDAAKKMASEESLAAMVKSLRHEFLSFLRTTAQQERKWENGKFDDRAATLRAKKTVRVLADFDTALPTVCTWAIKQIEGGRLRGAELEVATQLLMVPLAKLISSLQE